MQSVGQRPILIGECTHLDLSRHPYDIQRRLQGIYGRSPDRTTIPFRFRKEYLHGRGGLLHITV